MFGLSTSTLIKLIAALAVVLALGFHFWADSARAKDLQETKVALELSRVQLIEVTRAKDAVVAQIAEADKARLQVQEDLKATLTKLKAQNVPKTCEAAVKWAVRNKNDLNWAK